MGLKDFLKGLIPENLIKVDNHFDFRKIEVSGDNVTIGDQTINDPELIDKLLERISEYQSQSTLPVQVIHKDLEGGYEDYESVSISWNDSIKKLKTVLSHEDIECILMCRRIKLAYDRRDKVLVNKLEFQLEKNFPNKGYKVRNLVGAGYFDEMIIPFIEIYKSKFDDKWREEYESFYNDIIKFFPLAVFVGNGTSPEEVVSRIKERLELKVPFLRIHAIGSKNIKKVEQVVNQLRIEDQYHTEDDRHSIPSGLKAQIFTIKTSSLNEEHQKD